jgi:serine/threonine protein kinase
MAVDLPPSKWPDPPARGSRGPSRESYAVVTSTPQNGENDPRAGTVVAEKYRVLRLVGRGGMGDVYEALNLSLGKRVALKFVGLGRGSEPTVVARFHREAKSVAAITSAHVVQVFDSGETETGEPFLVMELLEGEDLAAHIRTRGRLSVAAATQLVTQALRGLRRAHAAGVVHRDLKPENLFLVRGEDGELLVKIVDFGLSKVALEPGSPAGLTQTGATVGTPLYMSPEQLEAAPDIDERADVWSMGAILHEALAGTPPFSESSYARLVLAICQRDPPNLRTLAPEVSEGLAAVVRRALSRAREDRFSSAEAMLAALLAAGPSAPHAVVSSPGVPEAAPSVSGPGSLPRSSTPSPASGPSSGPEGQAPGAELRAHTLGGATLWLSQAPSLALWRGEVQAPDRLRIEGRDGTIHELRLAPVGVLKLGRVDHVGSERNELVYPDVASRLAAILRHDGVRWWMSRRNECSVPVQVGARSLNRGDEGPLVHGTLVTVGGMRATLFDRRYVAPIVPAGAIDPTTGLLARVGLEQEVASFLARQKAGALVLVELDASAAAPLSDYPLSAKLAVAIHRQWPTLPVGLVDPEHAPVAGRRSAVVCLLFEGDRAAVKVAAERANELARACGAASARCGFWPLEGVGVDAGREIELALHAASLASPDVSGSLREVSRAGRLSDPPELLGASREARRATLLFAIEEQNALAEVGSHVVPALEQELGAIVAAHAGVGAVTARLAPGVVGVCVARKVEPTALGADVQCEWHARPPILDGKVELPRTLSWEVVAGDPLVRAADLAEECSDPHGVLSALSGGLPYPIAGRVHSAIAASSAIERVKMLFDILEGTWRFIATVLVSAFFAKRLGPRRNAARFRADGRVQSARGHAGWPVAGRLA